MQHMGLNVFKSELAVQITTIHEVVRVAIPKRRKRWRVVKVTRQVPCAIQTHDAVYVHPSIYDALLTRATRAASEAEKGKQP